MTAAYLAALATKGKILIELTPERRAALEAATHVMHEVTAFDHAKVIRAMLEEAGRGHEGA